MVEQAMAEEWLESVKWDEQGLVPVIAQDYQSSKVLMLAWMNRQALQLTMQEQRAIYWSRSRKKLWRKGEESGHVQQLKDIRLDCDNDVILLSVEQIGGIACHTGHERCFYQQLQYHQSQLKGFKDPKWQEIEPVVKNPNEIYS